MNQPATALRPLAFGEVLDVAIKICVRRWRVLVPITLVLWAPLGLAQQLLTVLSRPASGTGNDPFAPDNSALTTDELVAALGATLLGVAIVAIGVVVVQGALFRAIGDAYLGGDPTIGRSVSFALRRFPSLLWVTFLGWLLMALGFVACVIPGVYLYAALSIAVPVLLTEGTRGRKALGRSRRLVAGNWWRVFGLLVVAGLMTSIVSGVVVGVATGVVGGQGDAVQVIVGTLAQTLGSALTVPVAAAVTVVIYIDQRVRKEAFDLEMFARAIDGQVGLDAAPPAPTVATTPPGPSDFAAGDQPPYWPPPPGWKPRAAPAEPDTPEPDPDPAPDPWDR